MKDLIVFHKGHIQLALKTIPVATRSETLDSFARFNLWQVGLNYGHGWLEIDMCLEKFNNADEIKQALDTEWEHC